MACCVGTALVMLLHGLQRWHHILAEGGVWGVLSMLCITVLSHKWYQ